MDNFSKKELEEKFEKFLFNMSDQLDDFINKLETKGFHLDYTVNSLEELEVYLESYKVTTHDNDYNDASAYLGEVLRKNFDGQWVCNLDRKNNSLYYGFPVIIGHNKNDVLFSPFHTVRIFIIRPKRNFFIKVIDNQINPKEADFSGLETEEE